MLFPQTPASCGKIFWNNLGSKGVSQIFKILFQTGDIYIAVFGGVFFSDIFN